MNEGGSGNFDNAPKHNESPAQKEGRLIQNPALVPPEVQSQTRRRLLKLIGVSAIAAPVDATVGHGLLAGLLNKFVKKDAGTHMAPVKAPDQSPLPPPATGPVVEAIAQPLAAPEQQNGHYEALKEENKKHIDALLEVPLGRPPRKNALGKIIYEDPVRTARVSKERTYWEYLRTTVWQNPALTDQQKLDEMYRAFLGVQVDHETRSTLYENCFILEEKKYIESLDAVGRKRWGQIKDWCRTKKAPNGHTIHPMNVLLAEKSMPYVKILVETLQKVDPDHYFPFDRRSPDKTPYSAEDLMVNAGGVGGVRCAESGNFQNVGDGEALGELRGDNKQTRTDALTWVAPRIGQKIGQHITTSTMQHIAGSLAPNDAESGGAMFDQLEPDSIKDIYQDIEKALVHMSPEDRAKFGDQIFNPAHPLYGLVYTNLFLIKRFPEYHRGGHSTNADDEYNAYDKWNQWDPEIRFLESCDDEFRAKFTRAS